MSLETASCARCGRIIYSAQQPDGSVAWFEELDDVVRIDHGLAATIVNTYALHEGRCPGELFTDEGVV